MAYSNQLTNYGSFRYVVTGTEPGPFHTIQAAINQALTDGSTTTILVRPGLYTENLTLYTGINLQGADEGQIIISGIHTPPAAGTFSIANCTLQSATHIFNGANAGTCALTLTNCLFDLTNGYIFNLALWTGNLRIKDGTDQSVTNAIITNTAAAALEITDSAIGAGLTAMAVTGVTTVFNSHLYCPLAITGNAVVSVDGGSVVDGAITVANPSSLFMYNSRINSGALSAITTASLAGLVSLANVVIDSSAVAAIDGTGNLSVGEVVYKDSNNVAVTIVYNNATELHCSNLLANSSVEVTLGDVTITNGQLVLGISGGTNGQIPIAATGANPAWSTLTSPTGTVAFTFGANSIGIDAAGGVNWIEATVATTMAPTNGYITKIAIPGILNYTLPVLAAQGTVIEITGFSVGLFAILQNAGQQIHFGNVDTTGGAGGSITATGRYDSIRLVCTTANTDWNVLSSTGVFNIV
jgi:hypothetical protein